MPVNNLWGVVGVKCESCKKDTNVKTLADSKATTDRYVSSVDSVGYLVTKAAKLFLTNDLLPPSYHHAKRMQGRMTVASETVAELSLERVMKEESHASDGGLSVRGDFGWHNRANMKAQSGEYLIIYYAAFYASTCHDMKKLSQILDLVL